MNGAFRMRFCIQQKILRGQRNSEMLSETQKDREGVTWTQRDLRCTDKQVSYDNREKERGREEGTQRENSVGTNH
jgi:hypothetical protein